LHFPYVRGYAGGSRKYQQESKWEERIAENDVRIDDLPTLRYRGIGPIDEERSKLNWVPVRGEGLKRC
jgi:hypothetical protein